MKIEFKPFAHFMLVLSICLNSCGPTAPRSTLSDLPTITNPVIDPSWEKSLQVVRQTLRLEGSLESLSIPILQSPSLEKTWGKPQLLTSPEGYYQLSYRKPQNSLEELIIYGSPRPFPNLITPPKESVATMINDSLGTIKRPQGWRETAILGQPVRWFTEASGGGADGTIYSTEGFALTDKNGRTGYYRLVIESVTNAAPARFSQVSF